MSAYEAGINCYLANKAASHFQVETFLASLTLSIFLDFVGADQAVRDQSIAVNARGIVNVWYKGLDAVVAGSSSCSTVDAGLNFG